MVKFRGSSLLNLTGKKWVSEVINEDIIVDCHYCEYATCSDPNSWCNCNVDDFAYFDHKVKDSKKEAEECDWFEFCDIFPKD